jgi:hypothetical protein
MAAMGASVVASLGCISERIEPGPTSIDVERHVGASARYAHT